MLTLRNLVVAMGAASLLLAANAPREDGAAQASKRIVRCPEPQTQNYLAALEKMPRLRGVPESGKLPFGPNAVRLLPLAGLISGGGPSGFQMESLNSRATYRLHWRVQMEVKRVSRSGRPGRVLGVKEVRLGHPRSLWKKPIRLLRRLSSDPSYYRLDLSIYGSHDRLLGRFGEYVRVVPRRIAARLEVAPKVVSPGGLLRVRVFNPGTTSLSFGPAFTLERLTSTGWFMPAGPRQFWPPTATVISAGAVGRCEGFPLPSGLEAGSYRLSKKVASSKKNFFIRARFRLENQGRMEK
jgi:hypothetical protein